MKIITIKMSEDGRDDIVVARVEIASTTYAHSYYMSVKDGFVKFPAFTILDVTIEDEPTLDQKIVALEEDLTDAMIDKMDEAEKAIESGENEGDFDDYVDDPEAPNGERGIVYPENAAPELDHARQLVGEAVLALRGKS